MTEAMKNPLNKAKQTEDVIQGVADRSGKQAEQVIP
jgi:hypothetical protein